MNNIPQDTLQAVADAAFNSTSFGSLITRASHIDFPHQGSIRRAVIQHALDNPALAPFLAGGIGILRPIAEMPETVPDGCVKITGYKDEDGNFIFGNFDHDDTHGTILRLPAAEARQERPVGFNSALETWGAAEPTPPAEPEPAAQVPLVDLEQDDFKPGTWIEFPDGTRGEIDFVRRNRVHVGGLLNERTFTELRESGCRINTSLPDTGRWDATAWRPCSKPGK